MSGDDAGAAGGAPDLSARVGALEDGQKTIADRVEHLIGIVSGDGGKPPAAPAGDGDQVPAGRGAPGAIAHEIRAQLDKRDAEQRDADDKARRDGEVTALKEQVRQLTEQQPGPPPRRVERLMGWT